MDGHLIDIIGALALLIIGWIKIDTGRIERKLDRHISDSNLHG